MPGILPELKTRQDCDHLRERLGPGPVVALWATGHPLNTVDIMLYFRALLLQKGYTVLFLLKKKAVERFFESCPNDECDFVYELNDNTLLQYCPFISVIFTHDFCIGGRKVKNFSAKIVLFPHNIKRPFPMQPEIYVDYLVAVNSNYTPFNFSDIPNHAKINQNKTLTIIPAGYPKLDLYMAARQKIQAGPYKRIAFFPITIKNSVAGAKLSYSVYAELISQFLARYPDYEFVLRPRINDHNAPLFRNLRTKFSADSRFIFDIGMDNKKYLLASDLMITDQSTVVDTFRVVSLHPGIYFRPDLKIKSPYIKNTIGYFASSVDQVLASIEDALCTFPQWESSLKKEIDRTVSHAGKTLSYLSNHIDNILNDLPAKNWIVLDKGDTAYDKPADYLRLFSRPVPQWLANGSIVPFYAWAVSQHGENPKLALAALRFGLRAWSPVSCGLSALAGQLYMALGQARMQHVLGMLRHMREKEPGNAAVLVWLAEAFFRWEPSSRELSDLLAAAQGMTLDYVLAGMVARLTLECLHDSGKALSVLRKAEGRRRGLPCKQYLLYLFLLLENSCIEDGQALLVQWQELEAPDPILLLFCSRLLRLSGSGESMPVFFTKSGAHSINFQGFDISFHNARQAELCLLPVLRKMEKKAARDPDLWAACSKLHAACGHYEAAGVCGWKAIGLAEVDINFLLWLTEVMKKNGDQDSALKCAAIAGSLIKKIRNHA